MPLKSSGNSANQARSGSFMLPLTPWFSTAHPARCSAKFLPVYLFLFFVIIFTNDKILKGHFCILRGKQKQKEELPNSVLLLKCLKSLGLGKEPIASHAAQLCQMGSRHPSPLPSPLPYMICLSRKLESKIRAKNCNKMLQCGIWPAFFTGRLCV